MFAASLQIDNNYINMSAFDDCCCTITSDHRSPKWVTSNGLLRCRLGSRLQQWTAAKCPKRTLSLPKSSHSYRWKRSVAVQSKTRASAIIEAKGVELLCPRHVTSVSVSQHTYGSTAWQFSLSSFRLNLLSFPATNQ